MVLDHIIAYSNTGRYTAMPGLPVIPHPVIPLIGNLFYCLSTSAAADGTRAADWYRLDFSGVRPVCSCPGFTHRRDCPHVGLVAAQVDDLCTARTAQWAAARQEGRAA